VVSKQIYFEQYFASAVLKNTSSRGKYFPELLRTCRKCEVKVDVKRTLVVTNA
jgi:hypothetical protein